MSPSDVERTTTGFPFPAATRSDAATTIESTNNAETMNRRFVMSCSSELSAGVLPPQAPVVGNPSGRAALVTDVVRDGDCRDRADQITSHLETVVIIHARSQT